MTTLASPSRRTVTRFAFLIACFLGLPALLGGCSPQASINSRMSDGEIRTVIDAQCPPGTTFDQMNTKLDALHIKPRYRYSYTDAKPPQYIARLFGPEGFVLMDASEVVRWVDVVFVFTPQLTIDRYYLHRDDAGYRGGEPVGYPNWQPAYMWQHYPLLPPPPKADPLTAYGLTN